MLPRSPFTPYHPRPNLDNWHATRSHGVRNPWFQTTRKMGVLFGIASPNATDGERRYRFSFPDLEDKPYADESTYRGIVGEEIARMTVSEWMRRQAQRLGVRRWEMSQYQGRVPEPFAQGQRHELSHTRKYCINVFRDGTRLTEWDGLIEYQTRWGRGVIVIESKTAGAESFSIHTEEKRAALFENIVAPLQEIYHDHSLDVVLMTLPKTLFSNVGRRILRPGIINLHHTLTDHYAGLIPFTFPVSREKLDKIAKSHLEAHRFQRGETGNSVQGGRWYETDERKIVMFKGQRVERILQITDDGVRQLFAYRKRL